MSTNCVCFKNKGTILSLYYVFIALKFLLGQVYLLKNCYFTGELQELYRLTPIALIGGSFLPGSAGHNISEAAAASCAVLIGIVFHVYIVLKTSLY